MPIQAWIEDDNGNVASAAEVTLFSRFSGGSPFQLTLSGAPRNLRVGVVTTMLYLVKLRNIGAEGATDVTINNALPTGLEFLDSVPPPTTQNGNLLSYKFATLASGESKLIVIRAELGPAAVPGTTLTNTTTAFDEAGNYAQATFTGGVRAGAPSNTGRLEVGLTTVKRLTIVGDRPVKLKSTIAVTNGSREPAKNAVVTLDGPPSIVLDASLTSPAPSSQQTVDGKTRWTWNFAQLGRNESIKVTHTVPATLTDGTVLTLTARVSADDGRRDEETATVEIRKRD